VIYEYDLAVPANTLAGAPVSVDMALSPGIIHRLEVGWPAGCNNMVLISIRSGLHQVWPTNPDGYLKGNMYTLSIPVWHDLGEGPATLTAYGCSPGAAYDHAVTIRLAVQRREILQPPDTTKPILERLNRWFFGRTG